MQTASDIIQSLGKPAALSKETGIPLTTIVGWGLANFIPEWRRPALIALGKKRNVALKNSDFPPKAHRIKCKDRPFVAPRKGAQNGYAQSHKAKGATA